MTRRSRGRLLTVLGAGFGLAIIVGNTIGAGILRSPGDIAALLPVPALFFAAWLLGALYAGQLRRRPACQFVPRRCLHSCDERRYARPRTG